MTSLTNDSSFDKSVGAIQQLVDSLCQRIKESAQEGETLYDFERQKGQA